MASKPPKSTGRQIRTGADVSRHIDKQVKERKKRMARGKKGLPLVPLLMMVELKRGQELKFNPPRGSYLHDPDYEPTDEQQFNRQYKLKVCKVVNVVSAGPIPIRIRVKFSNGYEHDVPIPHLRGVDTLYEYW